MISRNLLDDDEDYVADLLDGSLEPWCEPPAADRPLASYDRPRAHISWRAVYRYWFPTLVAIGKLEEHHIVPDRRRCFACGMISKYRTELAHIHAHVYGGDEKPSNIHILCKTCHKDSEGLSVETYSAWFITRTLLDGVLSHFIRQGLQPMDVLLMSRGLVPLGMQGRLPFDDPDGFFAAIAPSLKDALDEIVAKQGSLAELQSESLKSLPGQAMRLGGD
jgi:hypothetical protein